MMSRYVLHHGGGKCSKPSSIQLTFETLMGTSFDIKVGGHDTISIIKSKIQTAEGIPSSQQHLLYNTQELDDDKQICSYPISSGATLKLIVSMRVGPISTKRAPEVDELAWRELQELISDTPKDDLINRLPPKTKLTVLIFQDGDQVNFLKVLENEDGTFSPLSDAWNGSSFRTLFSKANALPEDSEERLEENSISMGKVQELQERLEALAINERGRNSENPFEEITIDPTIAYRTFGSKTDSQRSVKVVSYLSSSMQHPSPATAVFPGRRDSEIGSQRTRVLFPSLFYPKMFSNRNRVKKEVEKVNQVYKGKKTVGAGSESSSGCGLKRPPLPEIRRSSQSDKEKVVCEEEKVDDKLREKTAASFAIVEEENAVSPAPVCSSQSSVVTLPATDETAAAAALSPTSADRITPTVSRSVHKVPSCELEDNEAQKTIPGKSDEGKGAKTEPAKGATKESKPSTAPKQKPINYTRLFRRLSRMVPVTKVKAIENGKERELKPGEYAPPLVRKEGEPSQKAVVKKRVRCTECKKKLNITNTYHCRCGDGPFCGEHRYSEAHDCAIDYRLQAHSKKTKHQRGGGSFESTCSERQRDGHRRTSNANELFKTGKNHLVLVVKWND